MARLRCAAPKKKKKTPHIFNSGHRDRPLAQHDVRQMVRALPPRPSPSSENGANKNVRSGGEAKSWIINYAYSPQEFGASESAGGTNTI